jgi:hypothetical protein
MKLRHSLLLAVLCVAACATGRHSSAGAWQSESGHGYLVVESERLIWFDPDHNDLSVGNVLQRGDELVTRHRGKIERVRLALADDHLVVTIAGKSETYHRIEKTPEAMSLSPLPLPAPAELPPATIASIQSEIEKRNAEDQQLLKAKAPSAKIGEVEDANDAYLRDVTARYGWIDLKRFGGKTSGAAIVMAKHSADTRLLLAATPAIERDLTTDPQFAQVFAIAYDQLLLSLGEKQRYGSQVCADNGENPRLCSVETPSALDSRRQSIGLTPIAEYLQLFSKMLYKGKTVSIPSDTDLQ